MLLDEGSVEGGVEYLDYVRMPALGEDIDLGEEALEAFLLVEHVLDPHDLDGYLIARG